jgi:hypothetical protein
MPAECRPFASGCPHTFDLKDPPMSALTRRLFGTRLLAHVGGAAALLSLTQRSAWALAAPVNKVVLTVSGKVSKRNAGATATFDMDMLAALPQQTFRTSTPWFQVPREFTGPLLRDVLAAAGATGSTLKATALNDYVTEIPASDATTYPVIVARLLDGKPMPVREKGPLWIVYPYDSAVELRGERYYNRSAWQLKSLEAI